MLVSFILKCSLLAFLVGLVKMWLIQRQF